MVEKGIEAKTRGLVKYTEAGSYLTDQKYALVECGSHNVYALKPSKFTKNIDLGYGALNSGVFLKSLTLKGFSTSDEVFNLSQVYHDIKAINNKKMPITADEYIKFLTNASLSASTNVGPTVQPGIINDAFLELDVDISLHDIDLKTLPAVFLNTNEKITIETPIGSLSIPAIWVELGYYNKVTFIFDKNWQAKGGIMHVTIKSAHKGYPDLNIRGDYTPQMARQVIVDGWTDEWLRNGNYKAFMANSEMMQNIVTALGSVVGGTGGLNLAGITEVLKETLARGAVVNDLRATSTTRGGNVTRLGATTSYFTKVTYPTKKQKIIRGAGGGTQYLTMADFEQNKAVTIEINQKFDDVASIITWAKTFGGELVSFDCELLTKYDEYEKYFQKMVRSGNL